MRPNVPVSQTSYSSAFGRITERTIHEQIKTPVGAKTCSFIDKCENVSCHQFMSFAKYDVHPTVKQRPGMRYVVFISM